MENITTDLINTSLSEASPYTDAVIEQASSKVRATSPGMKNLRLKFTPAAGEAMELDFTINVQENPTRESDCQDGNTRNNELKSIWEAS